MAATGKRVSPLLSFLLAASAGMAAASPPSPPVRHVEVVAREAVAMAVALPPGYHRDLVLRAVSRNLRWFGQPDAGVEAARAMSDHGLNEVAPGTQPRPPRFIPLREAMPSQNPCDAGIWREQDGSEARTPREREKWAENCLLRRDFHYIGLPEVEQVRTVAETLPPGDTKGLTLAMLIRSYHDATSLQLVERELTVHRAAFSAEAREGLTRLMADPAVLYAVGRKPEAVAAARAATEREPKQEIILMLLKDDAIADALAVFETLERAAPPEFGEGCSSWFNPIGGLQFWSLGNARSPSSTLGGFLDGLQSSPFFGRICSTGLPADEAIASLLIAGRYDAAIARAEREKETPFLLVDALLQSASAMMRGQERAKALVYAKRAGAALPLFDPGDRPTPPSPPGEPVVASTDMPNGPPRNYGERPGDTARRFEVMRVLAAAGAPDEAERLARQQPAGAMRAVALSAAVAGRFGLRFDDQAPSIESIEASTVWGTTP